MAATLMSSLTSLLVMCLAPFTVMTMNLEGHPRALFIPFSLPSSPSTDNLV